MQQEREEPRYLLDVTEVLNGKGVSIEIRRSDCPKDVFEAVRLYVGDTLRLRAPQLKGTDT